MELVWRYFSSFLCQKMLRFLNEIAKKGTVIKLGTERHRKLLDGIDDMTAIGCFALTELGYGNNAVEMETTSKYVIDPFIRSKAKLILTMKCVGLGYKRMDH